MHLALASGHRARLPEAMSFVAVAGFSFLVLLSTAELLTNFTTQEDNGQVFVIDMGRCGHV